MEDHRVVALVLAGGQGQRMGGAKPFVQFRGVPLVQHVVERLRVTFSRVCIVARDTEPFASLGLPVILDARPRHGPLVGLYSGLVESGADWCFAVGCDMPFLSSAVIEHMAGFLDSNDIVAARVDGRVQVLHAFYSHRCLPAAAELLGTGTTSLKALLQRCQTTVVPESSIASFDPGLLSFKDLDTPHDLKSLAKKGPSKT